MIQNSQEQLSFDALNHNKCWVTFRYPDNSIIYIFTTLNPDLLAGIATVPNTLYDFNKQGYIALDTLQGDGIVTEITANKPVLREVDVFANTFIQ